MESLTLLENAYPGISCSIHLTCYTHGGESRKTYIVHAHTSDSPLSFRGETLNEAVEAALRYAFAKPGELQKAIEEIYEITEAQADGAPDANPKDKLANWIAGKLAPFIPTHKR